MVPVVVNNVCCALAVASGPASGIPPWWLLLILLLTAVPVTLAVVLTRRIVRRQLLRDVGGLARQVARLRENPNAPASPAAPELRPLQEQVQGMAVCYRTALADLVSAREALENLRNLQDRYNTERGFSHSFIQRRKASKGGGGSEEPNEPMSRRMVGRLTPNLHWMATTPALQSFLGRTSSELTGRPFLDTVHPDDRDALAEALAETITTGEFHGLVFRARARGGAARHLQLDAQARYTDEGRPLHLRCHFLDVTERVRTEEQLHHHSDELARVNEHLREVNSDLQRLKESYRDLYHQAPVMYFSLDPRGHFAACNETMMQMLGYAREDLFTQPYTLILPPAAVAEWQRQTAARRGRHPLMQAGELEASWVRKDGSVLDVWIRSAPLHTPEGRFVRSRSAAQDVTERNRLAHALADKARDLEQANILLRRTNQELDQFTYVVSHDLKEPLRTLEAFSNFLQEDYRERLDAQGLEYLEHLRVASRRLSTQIDSLLTLSRAGRVISTPRPFDPADAIATVCDDLAGLIQRKGAVVRVEGPFPTILGDAQRVTELLANLIGNGLKYNASPNPEIVVGFAGVRGQGSGVPSQESGKESLASLTPDPRPLTPVFATLFVRDNGIGIDPKHHEQVFALFRRLHRPEEYEGTGAGLAICRKIVEAHGGRIWVESELGRGATFYLTLPLA